MVMLIHEMKDQLYLKARGSLMQHRTDIAVLLVVLCTVLYILCSSLPYFIYVH